MAHLVSINLPAREIGNSDVTFVIKKDGKPFGKLRVSKGGVDWISAPGRKARKKSWAELDSLFLKKKEAAARKLTS